MKEIHFSDYPVSIEMHNLSNKRYFHFRQFYGGIAHHTACIYDMFYAVLTALYVGICYHSISALEISFDIQYHNAHMFLDSVSDNSISEPSIFLCRLSVMTWLAHRLMIARVPECSPLAHWYYVINDRCRIVTFIEVDTQWMLHKIRLPVSLPS